MNQATLIGRITRNLSIKTSTTGKSFVYFTLAINDVKDYTDYVNCVAWNKNAENMAKYVGKGSLVSVVGRITSRKNNNDQYITEVVANNVTFLDAKRKDLPDNADVFDDSNEKEVNKNVNINEAFQNKEDYNSEISFINNNNVTNNDNDSDEDAIIWD